MPNSKSTKAEIQAYLDGVGIAYNDEATKAELLALIPATDSELHEAEQVEEVIESEVVEEIPDVELEKVDVEEVPDLPVVEEKPKPEVKEPKRFTKWQLVYQSSFSPQQKDLFKLSLEDNVPYTLEEVWILVDEFIESLWW
ncbi:hypothetical protein [Weissella tructae]